MTDSIYRIIDANFNRAREAFRVMEEYCRFSLNHPVLSKRTKQARHQLCETLKAIDPGQLLYNRDTSADIGRMVQIDGHLKRTTAEDCFTAAAKRASEALRALAEASQTVNPAIASVMEQLRFEVYAIEKQTYLFNHTKSRFGPVRLYVLINADEKTNDNTVLNLVRSCIDGGADCIQLRAKNISDQRYLSLARSFCASCRQGKVVSIINDRVDIAVLSEADGVHLGQDEIPVSGARKIADRPLIIGVSTHNLNELNAAIATECDYVGIGPAFPSPTKPYLVSAGTIYIQQALEVLKETGIFHVAIGGINQENLGKLLDIGVSAVAVSGAVENAGDPENACKRFKSVLLGQSH